MRPRPRPRKTRSFRVLLLHTKGCFNEAAAAAAENDPLAEGYPLLPPEASMRPRPRPRKTGVSPGEIQRLSRASMRPRPRPRKTEVKRVTIMTGSPNELQ